MNEMSPSQRLDYFHQSLLRVVPRFFSAMDRCPVSASRGCLDREYWAWATKEFANMDMQRGVLVMAFVYANNFADNQYYLKKAVLKWVEWGIEFWIKRQSGRGAFDHLYPFENSWMATAFTLCDMLETYRLLEEQLNASLKDVWLEAMNKAGSFLCTYDETHGFISNHRAGAAAALLGLAKLTGNHEFHRRAWDLMDEIYEKQSPEGWFLEYEGADPGYQTLDTHYQARFHFYADNDARVEGHVQSSLQFLQWFVAPDGSIGGDYGSRNCPHYFPGGLEWFAALMPEAEAIASCCTDGLVRGSSAGIQDADIRNEVVMATSYVYAASALAGSLTKSRTSTDLPWQKDNSAVVFEQAGVAVHATSSYYMVFGASKGGVVKVFDKVKGQLCFSSSGFTARLGNQDITTHMFQPVAPIVHDVQDNQIHYSCTVSFFHYKRNRLAAPWLFLLFRIFNYTAGRSRILSDFVRKHLIIGRYLKKKVPVPINLCRSVQIHSREIIISDVFDSEGGTSPEELVEHGFFATVYMASARYFREQDLYHSWDETIGIKDSQGNGTGMIVLESGKHKIRKISFPE